MAQFDEVTSCSERPPCPGCPGLGAAHLPHAVVAEAKALCARLGAPEPESLWLGARGYRHRVRLSVREVGGLPRLGIFEEGSHRLVPIPNCPLHHPALVELATLLETECARHRVPSYDEGNHRGVLRAVQLAVERATGLVQVVLVCRDKLGPGSHARAVLRPVLEELAQHPRVHSVFLNAQPERTNTLLGPTMEWVSGPEAIVDTSGGARIFYPPGAFGQANPFAHDCAVARIHASVPDGARVVEFYAGTGSIGLGLAHRAAVQFNEVGPDSLRGLAMGIAALGPEIPVPPVHQGPAEACLQALGGADVVVVDPPRKGLSPQVVSELCRTRPGVLWYLSCGFESFVRDADLLAAAFRLESVTLLPYFPYTDHVETLARFVTSP